MTPRRQGSATTTVSTSTVGSNIAVYRYAPSDTPLRPRLHRQGQPLGRLGGDKPPSYDAGVKAWYDQVQVDVQPLPQVAPRKADEGVPGCTGCVIA